jgi:AhpD family alkylhydroperoxidase
VKMRASQINGCAYCIDMHSKDARAAGESEQRLYALSVWRETPFSRTGSAPPRMDRSCHAGLTKPCPRRCI